MLEAVEEGVDGNGVKWERFMLHMNGTHFTNHETEGKYLNRVLDVETAEYRLLIS